MADAIEPATQDPGAWLLSHRCPELGHTLLDSGYLQPMAEVTCDVAHQLAEIATLNRQRAAATPCDLVEARLVAVAQSREMLRDQKRF